MKQEIRIIGGQYRGKKLQFPHAEGLRPTPDRVRETLFNWLMHDIRDARCLDAFAGSGALGFEAFSRGAASVFLLEQSPVVAANLEKIVRSFNNPALKLIKTDTLLFLKKCTQAFDVIFLDPPFAENYLPECITAIEENNLLPNGGLLYVESPTVPLLNEMHWQQMKLKQAGQVVYALFQKKADA